MQNQKHDRRCHKWFLLDKEKAIELAESGLDEIRFSFEGENPELYEKSEEAVIIIEFLKTYNIF